VSLSRIDLNLLLVLDTVLTERSVARAAQRLHVTPSAISNGLARLRVALGDPLVIRRGRGIVPTPRAQSLAPLLASALRALEGSVAAETFDPATTTRSFTVALSDAGQIARLPAAVSLLGREMPHATLRVVGIDTYLSWGGVASTELDAAVVGTVDNSAGVRTLPLYREESVLVARRGHRLARGAVTRAQLARLRHVEVHVAPGHGYRDLAAGYRQQGIRREVAAIVPSFIAAAAVIAATDLVGTLPASLVEVIGPRLGVRALGGPAPTVTTQINLLWHERTLADRATGAFRDVLVKALGDAR
jgi:DNA-binding transcriptional LysR family regulator